MNAKLILVAVPSLALVRQSLTDWAREFLAHNIKPDWFCVCADELVGNLERDTFVGRAMVGRWFDNMAHGQFVQVAKGAMAEAPLGEPQDKSIRCYGKCRSP